MTLKTDPTIITAVFNRIFNQCSALNEQRLRNRHICLIVGGAIIGFALKESSTWNAVIMYTAAVVTTLVFWYQDHRLHKKQHVWRGADRHIRSYLKGDIKENEFELVRLDSKEEEQAKIICRSSGFTLLVVIVGAVLVAIFKVLASQTTTP